MQGFTITVTAALSGKLFWTLTSKHAGSLFVRYLKLAIQKRPGLPSPFTVCMLKEAEIVDDFCHLQDITDTNELHLEFVLQKRRRPEACQKLALTEAIGHQLSRSMAHLGTWPSAHRMSPHQRTHDHQFVGMVHPKRTDAPRIAT